MRKIWIIFICMTFLAALKGLAQGYTIENLSVENGLSNNYVKDIVQDGQGFIWIGTETGLSRFDGQNFTNYSITNSDLKNDAVNTLIYDRYDNLLWIGTKTVLSVLDCSTGQFINFDEKHDTQHPEIINIVDMEADADSAIWIATHHNGIVHYNKRTRQFTPYTEQTVEGLKNSNWCILNDGKGKLYVGHARQGFSIIDIANKTSKHFYHQPGNPKSLPGNSVYSIYIDHLQNIWLGTNQGLALFNPRKEDFLVFKHDPANPHSLIADHIYDISEMNNGTLWIGSDIGGISILDLYSISFTGKETIKFTNLTATSEDNDLSSGNIRSLLQDSFGNIWIGNYSSGVDFISHTPPLFHSLPYKIPKLHRFKNKPVWGIYADNQQQIWVGSENEIAIFKNNRLQNTIDLTPYQSRPYAQVFSMKGDNRGSILLGLYDDGLLQLDMKSKRIRRLELGADYIDIITFYEDTDSRMWIGAEYGVYTFMNDSIRWEEKISSQLTDRSVYGILRDRQGKLWIGSYSDGISIFDENQNLCKKLNEKDGFPSGAINYLCLDKEGGVWIATRNGLGYIKDTHRPEEFKWYGVQHGLENPFIRSIQEDLLGNIWLSTNQGISLWDKNKQKFNNYNRKDGIPSGNFIEGSSCVTADGTVYFGSLNGVCYFNPEDVIFQHPVAPIQIIECKGLQKQVDSSNAEIFIPFTVNGINLKYNENSFRIIFSVPDYSQNQQVEYAYMIEGLEDSWSNTLGENHVTFRNISPGKYLFKVQARLKNQDWDESHTAVLSIYIHPPFWFTWYAKLFYLVSICLILLAFFLSYKRRLKLRSSLEIEKQNSLNEQNLNQERLRFYTNITHELRTPLTLILGPLEDLTHDKKLPAPYDNTIITIYRSAVRLLNLINQILEFRKMETHNQTLTVSKGDLANLVTEIGLRYKELNRNPRLNISIGIETDRNRLYFDSDVITTILDNLLSNAVKYTPEGKIEMTLRSVKEQDREYTEIKVADTGYGIDPDSLPHIFDRYYQAKGKHQASGTGIGLALVKSLAELHQGTLEVESIVGKETCFTFRILTENTYPDALHKDVKSWPNQEQLPVLEDDQKKQDNTLPVLLVVEDNDDIREYIFTSFSSEYKIVEATNGKEGLVQAFDVIPNIIVSDIMMPEMDGIEFCRIIKEDVRTSHIPVILLTAKDSIRDKEEGYDSGADSYLTKPFSAGLLRTRMRNLLETRRKLASEITNRSQNLVPEPDQEPIMSKLDEDFLNKLTTLIEDNLDDEKLDNKFMTQEMNMSHSTLYRKVKGLTGISPNEFIRKIKLKNSLKLLLSGDYNISEAAYMTGFNNLSYFRECFREEYGASPSEYMKKK